MDQLNVRTQPVYSCQLDKEISVHKNKTFGRNSLETKQSIQIRQKIMKQAVKRLFVRNGYFWNALI